MRSTKKRRPKLTRLEKMTKGLMLSAEQIKSKFSVREVEEKGRALFLVSKVIRKDSFVLEYEGDIISHDEAVFREKIYEMNDEGCYILFFRFQERRLAIDATRKFGSYARYLNHSREPNIRFHAPLLLDLTGQGVPRIAAYALRDIYEGEEIVFDYGIKDGKISWLRNRKRCHASELTDSSSEEESSSSDDSQASKKDQIMSITRTPKQNPSLKPSKYLAPVRMPTTNSKPPSLTLPRDGYGIRYIAYQPRPGMKRCYIASMEGLGQPLKIMRSVEERSTKGRDGEGSKSAQSIISLSESDDSSVKSPTNFIPSDNPSSSRSSCLPLDTTPSSASKVLEWQQKIKSSPVKEQSDASNNSDIKIIHVVSLQESNKVSTSSSSSPSSLMLGPSHDYSQSKVSNDTISNIPCIANVMNGSSVAKHFVPAMYSNVSNHDGTGKNKMSGEYIPYNGNSTKHTISHPQSPLKLINSSNGIRGGAMNNESPSSTTKSSSNPLLKQSDGNEMICLSDSEEEVTEHISRATNNVNHFPQTSAVELNKTSSLRKGIVNNTDKSTSFTEHFHNISGQGKMQTIQHSQRKGIVGDIVISNVESLNPGRYMYNNQRGEVHTVFQSQRRDVQTVFQNHRNGVQSESQHQNRSIQGGIVQREYQNVNGCTVRYEYNQNNEVQKEFIDRGNSSHSQVKIERQSQRKDLLRVSQGKSDTKKDDDVDVVEIIDEEENDLEIILDGEVPSSSISASRSVQSSLPSSRHKVISSLAKPSCSKVSTVPSDDAHHHRYKPHVAIVKPYSKENDQDIILEEHLTEENHLQKSAEYDIIEVIEGNSSEEDDGIILAEDDDKPFIKHKQSELTQKEIQMMEKIFQPLILSSDSLSSSCVERAISDNFNFFSVLIGRGVLVNEIRRTVWKLFKTSRKEKISTKV